MPRYQHHTFVFFFVMARTIEWVTFGQTSHYIINKTHKLQEILVYFRLISHLISTIGWSVNFRN